MLGGLKLFPWEGRGSKSTSLNGRCVLGTDGMMCDMVRYLSVYVVFIFLLFILKDEKWYVMLRFCLLYCRYIHLISLMRIEYEKFQLNIFADSS